MEWCKQSSRVYISYIVSICYSVVHTTFCVLRLLVSICIGME